MFKVNPIMNEWRIPPLHCVPHCSLWGQALQDGSIWLTRWPQFDPHITKPSLERLRYRPSAPARRAWSSTPLVTRCYRHMSFLTRWNTVFSFKTAVKSSERSPTWADSHANTNGTWLRGLSAAPVRTHHSNREHVHFKLGGGSYPTAVWEKMKEKQTHRGNV